MSRVKLQANLASGTLHGSVDKLELVVYPNTFLNVLTAKEAQSFKKESFAPGEFQSTSPPKSDGKQQQEGRTFWESIVRKFTIKLDINNLIVTVLADKPTRKSLHFTVHVQGLKLAKLKTESELCQHHFFLGSHQVDVSVSLDHKLNSRTPGSSLGVVKFQPSNVRSPRVPKPKEAIDNALWIDIKVLLDKSSRSVRNRLVVRGGISEIQMFLTPKSVLYLLHIQKTLTTLGLFDCASEAMCKDKHKRQRTDSEEMFIGGYSQDSNMFKMTADLIQTLDDLPERLARVGNIEPGREDAIDDEKLRKIFELKRQRLQSQENLMKSSAFLSDSAMPRELSQSVIGLEQRAGMDIDTVLTLDTAIIGYSPEEQTGFQTSWASCKSAEQVNFDHDAYLNLLHFDDILLDHIVFVMGKAQYVYYTPKNEKAKTNLHPQPDQSHLSIDYLAGRMYRLEKEPQLEKIPSDLHHEPKPSMSRIHTPLVQGSRLIAKSQMEDSFVIVPDGDEANQNQSASALVDESMFHSVADDVTMFKTAPEQGIWSTASFLSLTNQPTPKQQHPLLTHLANVQKGNLQANGSLATIPEQSEFRECDSLFTEQTVLPRNDSDRLIMIKKQMDTPYDVVQAKIRINGILRLDIEPGLVECILDPSGYLIAVDQIEPLLTSELRVCRQHEFVQQEAKVLYSNLKPSQLEQKINTPLKLLQRSATSTPLSPEQPVFLDLTVDFSCVVVSLFTESQALGHLAESSPMSPPARQPAQIFTRIDGLTMKRNDLASKAELSISKRLEIGTRVDNVSHIWLEYLPAAGDTAFISDKGSTTSGIVSEVQVYISQQRLDKLGLLIQRANAWLRAPEIMTRSSKFWNKRYSDFSATFSAAFEHFDGEYKIWSGLQIFLQGLAPIGVFGGENAMGKSEIKEVSWYIRKVAIIVEEDSGRLNKLHSQLQWTSNCEDAEEWMTINCSGTVGNGTRQRGILEGMNLSESETKRILQAELEHIWLANSSQLPGKLQCSGSSKDLSVIIGSGTVQDSFTWSNSFKKNPLLSGTGHTELLLLTSKFGEHGRTSGCSVKWAEVDSDCFSSEYRRALGKVDSPFLVANLKQVLGQPSSPTKQGPATTGTQADLIFSPLVLKLRIDYFKLMNLMTTVLLNLLNHEVFTTLESWKKQLYLKQTLMSSECMFYSAASGNMSDSFFVLASAISNIDLSQPAMTEDEGEYREPVELVPQTMEEESSRCEGRSRAYNSATGVRLFLKQVFIDLMHDSYFRAVIQVDNLEIVTPEEQHLLLINEPEFKAKLNGAICMQGSRFSLSLTSDLQAINLDDCYSGLSRENFDEIAELRNPRIELHMNDKGQTKLAMSVLTREDFEHCHSELRIIPKSLATLISLVEHLQTTCQELNKTLKLYRKQKKSAVKPAIRENPKEKPRTSRYPHRASADFPIDDDEFEVLSVHHGTITEIINQLEAGDYKTSIGLMQDYSSKDPEPDFSFKLKLGSLHMFMADDRDPQHKHLPHNSCLEMRFSELNLGTLSSTRPADDYSSNATREWLHIYLTMRGVSIIDQVPESAFQYFMQTESKPIVMTCRLVKLVQLQDDGLLVQPSIRHSQSASTRKLSHHDEIEMRELTPVGNRPRLGSASFESPILDEQDYQLISRRVLKPRQLREHQVHSPSEAAATVHQ